MSAGESGLAPKERPAARPDRQTLRNADRPFGVRDPYGALLEQIGDSPLSAAGRDAGVGVEAKNALQIAVREEDRSGALSAAEAVLLAKVREV